MPFEKGQSGNPSGRKKTATSAKNLRETIAQEMPDIITMLVNRAKGGDVAAAKVLIDRVMPPIKPMEAPITIETTKPENAKSLGYIAFNKMLQGELSAEQTIKVFSVLTGLAEVVDVNDRMIEQSKMRKLLEAIENDAKTTGNEAQI